jgi:hypothetical protein
VQIFTAARAPLRFHTSQTPSFAVLPGALRGLVRVPGCDLAPNPDVSRSVRKGALASLNGQGLRLNELEHYHAAVVAHVAGACL